MKISGVFLQNLLEVLEAHDLAMETQDTRQNISFGPYISYLGLSSIFKGEQKKAFLNDIGIGPLDAGLGAYYLIQGPIVGFQVGGKVGFTNANQDVNLVELSPATGTGGFIRNLSLEIGMIF